MLEAEVEQLALELGQLAFQLSVCISRSSLAFIRAILLQILADHKFALDGQLVHGQAQRFARGCFIHIVQLEQHTARLHDGNPVFGEPLPEPMRVSAGFSVTGLSGKILIQTLPPRLM
jgi:hypothetical protein